MIDSFDESNTYEQTTTMDFYSHDTDIFTDNPGLYFELNY